MDQSYPVQVRARLDEPLLPWLWLVKWLLAIPHYIVLFFLWIAFAVVTVIAFFAILFTGRYPRSLFKLRTGGCCAGHGGSATTPTVPWRPTATRRSAWMRSRTTPRRWTSPTLSGSPAAWSWSSGGCWPSRSTSSSRCSPAALPTPRPAPRRHTWQADALSGGLIGLLVCFAAITLLFAGRYPRGLYDFIVGMNRWVLRVIAYAALMTDAYPPFRLDQGGADRARTRARRPRPSRGRLGPGPSHPGELKDPPARMMQRGACSG